MDYKYFDITINNENLGEREYTFYFVEHPYHGVIAKDDCSNHIFHKRSGVFIYVNDADEEQNSIKLFNNLEEFYKNIEIYDEVEFYKRGDSDFVPHEDGYIPKCSMLISQFVKLLGGKRFINKYKEGSSYNVTNAYIDGTITYEEFKMLMSSDIIKEWFIDRK